MRWAANHDQDIYLTVGPSGGRPDHTQAAFTLATLSAPPGPGEVLPCPGPVHVAGDVIFRPYLERSALLGALGRRIVHWVVFRGGWTVYVDAPDRDPITIRCTNRVAAETRAAQLAAEIRVNGIAAVDLLAR